MKSCKHHFLLLAAAALLAGCGQTGAGRSGEPAPRLADPAATRETKALLANLKRLAPDHVLFGHQDDLAYGVTWKREAGRSDVKETAGAYPALYGWELGDLETGALQNLDGVRFDDMQRWIEEGYLRGGVVTVSWHMDNPVTKGSSWDTTRAVRSILPGGEHHAWYRAALDRFADFIRGIEVGPFAWLGFGRPVPIIFRPFHEHTGSWFWWGADQTRPEDYVALWRFTVEYLRDEQNLHNLLYAYSTDVFRDEEHYLERYPGDDYVDVMGFDDYQGVRSDEAARALSDRLGMLVRMAEARDKLPALTETGLEGVPVPDFWTGRLLRALQADPQARRIAYVMVWRNANRQDNPGHHYAPYPGHSSAPDFVRFYQDPFVLFEDELPDLYE